MDSSVYRFGVCHWTELVVKVLLTEVSLRTTDYERVFAVLDRCADVRTVPEFRTRIVGAMIDVFPIRVATCFVGDTYEGQFADPDATVAGAAAWERKRAVYQQNWARFDVFGTPEARRCLEATRVASLADLHSLPAESATYVREYLDAWRSVNALHLDLPGNARALVGLYDVDENALGPRDVAALRLLARQLSVLTRGLVNAPGRDLLAALTERQRDVARLVADGLSNAAIARRLILTEDTVKKYVSRILAATGCASRTQLAVDVQRQSFGPPAT
ncbi:helix-turn-helix transcriptional regulator [Prescottella agglutinans]|uniref:helix-turn-helix transcriptional regulator n=1 Tax=Prescottella agglutinans TaxID=1644129 RepID=UPI001F4D78FD|nr:LuxR C-terminal-related transcriptional regulator [Prescottella agglutinans]